MSSDTQVIIAENLVRKFGDLTAVDGISFSIRQSEIFAFLGPNGAGKTTTIRMLITLLSPSAGRAIVGGYDIVHKPAEVRRIIGYVPQMLSVDGTLTAKENLMLMAQLYDVPAKERKARVSGTLEFLKLTDYADSLVRTFSGGMIRKLEVGLAMIHHPKVLFLDEPTTGLDPIAKQNVWQHLRQLRDQFGTTIFFSTHNMDEAAEVSDNVAIMNKGKIAAIGSVAELTARTGAPDATLEDSFLYFTGNSIAETGSFREIRRTRQTERRLG
ncbi:MAG TPA: ATP-binding cassette domain-containing protein [Bacteroidota bacterium]|nr:ATP-binding cassette domain-containing protein [Bacteroidota bacterium]